MSTFDGADGGAGGGNSGGGEGGGGSGGGSGSNGPPRHREWKLGCKVYIGNLAEGVSKADVEAAFSKYGALRNVWVARNPPGFAFVEFEDSREAEDACRQMDGIRIAGARIRAEMSHGRTRRPGRGPPGGFRGGPPPFGGGGGGGYSRGYRGGPSGAGGGYNGDYYGGGGGHHHGRPYHGHQGRDHMGGGYNDRPPRERYPRPRSPPIKEYNSNVYSRSRSVSPASKAQNVPKAARPRTPPSRSITPERR